LTIDDKDFYCPIRHENAYWMQSLYSVHALNPFEGLFLCAGAHSLLLPWRSEDREGYHNIWMAVAYHLLSVFEARETIR